MGVIDLVLKVLRDARRKVRAVDTLELWPAIWDRVRGDLPRFLAATRKHIAGDGAWRYPKEWMNTEQDPTQWAARKQGLLTYFDQGGVLRNLDGSRSIFDDVDT